jgi:hypothetical protein
MKLSGGVFKPFITYLVTGVCFCVIFLVTFVVNQGYIKKNTDLVRAAVAVHPVGVYAPIGPTDFKLTDVPALYAGTDCVTDMEVFFKDKAWFTKELGMGEGDILRPSRLSSHMENDQGLLAMMENQHKMMVSVETTLIQSCANLVFPGVKVNAVVFIPGKEGYDSTEDQVIGPDQDMRLAGLQVVDKRNSDGKPMLEANDANRQDIPFVVTLMLDQEEMERAQALIAYGEKGKIYLLPVGFEGELYLELKQGGMTNT